MDGIENDTRALGAIDLLARLLASTDDPFSLGVAASVAPLPDDRVGVSAEIELPSGDRYRVAVEWIGDREGSPS